MNDLRTKLIERLADLQRETELGEERLHALENERIVLRQTLLRIDGATQVLRELLDGLETAQNDVGLEAAGSSPM